MLPHMHITPTPEPKFHLLYGHCAPNHAEITLNTKGERYPI